MSTTIPETTETRSERAIHSRRGEPTWEMALLYPQQGEWSEEEYLALDIGKLVEFTDGVVEFLPMPTLSHQDIVRQLLQHLSAFVEKRNLGRVYFAPCPVRLRDGKYREPDVFLLKHERIKDRHSPPDGADLVMEVVSDAKSGRQRDLVEKRADYAEAGIPEYWIIDPQERKILVFALDEKTYRTHGEFIPGQTATSRLLPEFALSVDDVFAAGEGEDPRR